MENKPTDEQVEAANTLIEMCDNIEFKDVRRKEFAELLAARDAEKDARIVTLESALSRMIDEKNQWADSAVRLESALAEEKAKNADLEAGLKEAAIEKAHGSRKLSDCGHNAYWTGYFGTCFACAREHAENRVVESLKENATLRSRLSLRDGEIEARQIIIGKLETEGVALRARAEELGKSLVLTKTDWEIASRVASNYKSQLENAVRVGCENIASREAAEARVKELAEQMNGVREGLIQELNEKSLKLQALLAPVSDAEEQGALSRTDDIEWHLRSFKDAKTSGRNDAIILARLLRQRTAKLAEAERDRDESRKWAAAQARLIADLEKEMAALGEPMECGHFEVNLQPCDEGPEVCIVCSEIAEKVAALEADLGRAREARERLEQIHDHERDICGGMECLAIKLLTTLSASAPVAPKCPGGATRIGPEGLECSFCGKVECESVAPEQCECLGCQANNREGPHPATPEDSAEKKL